jgi:hypothetical protein
MQIDTEGTERHGEKWGRVNQGESWSLANITCNLNLSTIKQSCVQKCTCNYQ